LGHDETGVFYRRYPHHATELIVFVVGVDNGDVDDRIRRRPTHEHFGIARSSLDSGYRADVGKSSNHIHRTAVVEVRQSLQVIPWSLRIRGVTIVEEESLHISAPAIQQ
jgi:hypothetical protein